MKTIIKTLGRNNEKLYFNPIENKVGVSNNKYVDSSDGEFVFSIEKTFFKDKKIYLSTIVLVGDEIKPLINSLDKIKNLNDVFYLASRIASSKKKISDLTGFATMDKEVISFGTISYRHNKVCLEKSAALNKDNIASILGLVIRNEFSSVLVGEDYDF